MKNAPWRTYGRALSALRYLALDDPSVEIVVFRDSDSRIGLRDKERSSP